MKSESLNGPLESETTVRQMNTGPFMITLCRLAKPVSLRPPQAPQLKAFTFFTGQLRQRDGSDALYLHMGYFATLRDAQRWARRVHTRYPSAFATYAPTALQQLEFDLPRPEAPPSGQTALASQDARSVEDEWFTDTQLMRLLETRRAGAIEDTVACDTTGVELLRPDDTGTRRILKEAVVKGTPIPFAVQLYWSAQPIDSSRVPRLDVFNGYTLYRTERRRQGRSCYFLRLGFFEDAISAKQVACSARSSFASTAVVPVTEEEFMHANEARIDIPAPAEPLQLGMNEAPDPFKVPAQNLKSSASIARAETEKPKATSETLEQLQATLELLAERERWTNSDSLDDSGVRHLRIAFEKIGSKSTRSPSASR